MQNGFLREGNLASDRNLAVLPQVVNEVENALAKGWKVIFTADTHEVEDEEFKMFPEHCVRGTSEAELADELKKFVETDTDDQVWVVPKRRYSAMFETQLEGLLNRFEIDDVRICGVCTDICVMHTTSDLRNRDITVTVAAPATATFDAPGHDGDQVHAFALAHMEGILGATVER